MDVGYKFLSKIRENHQLKIIEFNGLDLLILKDVFSPDYFRASKWMAERVSELVGRKSLLEIGTGTGITALICAKNGAKVVATDINSSALRNAKINALLNEIKIDVRESDVYSKIKKSEKFDIIFWNHPFDNSSREVLDDLSKSIYDPGYEKTEEFIRSGKNYLKKNGRILLGTGMSANFSKLQEIAKKNNLIIKELFKVTLPPRNKIKVPFDIMILEFYNSKVRK